MNKLSDPIILEKVNRNKKIFEPNSELVEIALRNYRSDLLLNQNAYAQQENEEVLDQLNSEINENHEEGDEFELHNEEKAHNLPPATVHASLLSEEELNSAIESLNAKQREIFDVVYTWAKRFVQNKNMERPQSLKPLQIFLSAAGGCGKSYLVKCLYNVLNKLLSRKGDASKAKILLLAPTGVAAINIDGTTIHTGMGLVPILFHLAINKEQILDLNSKKSVLFSLTKSQWLDQNYCCKFTNAFVKFLECQIVFLLQTKLLLPVVIFINYLLY